MRAPLPLLLLLFLVGSCGLPGSQSTHDDRSAPADTNWMADLKVTAVDTTVRLCGSGKRYRLTGPALDTIADRYRYANTHKGQWMKLWFSGHLGAVQETV